MNLSQYQEVYQKALIERNHLDTQGKKIIQELLALESQLQILDRVQTYIQVKAQETQNQLSIKVEDLVQLGIDTCFPGIFQFKLEFKPNGRGKTDACLDLIQDGWPIDPLESCGGGVASIEAFGLRIASWSLQQNNNVMWLDEPFKDINGESIKRAACEVLREVSHRLGLQLIIITGDPHIVEVADQVVDMSIRIDRSLGYGVSRAKRLSAS